jgi:hypothetical protein
MVCDHVRHAGVAGTLVAAVRVVMRRSALVSLDVQIRAIGASTPKPKLVGSCQSRDPARLDRSPRVFSLVRNSSGTEEVADFGGERGCLSGIQTSALLAELMIFLAIGMTIDAQYASATQTYVFIASQIVCHRAFVKPVLHS